MSELDRKIRIIIVDNNEDFTLEVENSLMAVPNFDVVGKAYDGEAAVREIVDKKPDIVILELVIPLKDGIAVLEEIRERMTETKPIVIVLTAIGNEKYIKKALSLGAEYYILKPFDMNLLTKRIMQIYDSSENLKKTYVEYKKSITTGNSENKESLETKTPTQRELAEIYVKTALRDIGVPAHLSGYFYLQKAIVETVLSEHGTIPITKQLYPIVAEHFNTSPGKVERAIRGAIQKVWQRGDPQKLKIYFTYAEKRKGVPPTNSEFIATIADKIRMTYMLK